MEEQIIGREKELADLQDLYDSGRPEFVAVYGRRRVGKTFLVEKFFKFRYDFYTCGVLEKGADEQRKAFYDSLKDAGYSGEMPGSWKDFFHALTDIVKRHGKKKRYVMFIDEVSCFDTWGSGFVSALAQFWNKDLRGAENAFLVICGSASSWIIKEVIDDRGALHNRVTSRIHVRPFSLYQTEKYIRQYNTRWSRLQIMRLYMTVGGIPFYLRNLKWSLSVDENIDRMFFGKDHFMKDEYERLFRSLFRNPDRYMDIIKLLADTPSGLTRDEILKGLKLESGSHTSDMLKNLVLCDFIRVSDNVSKGNTDVYQLIDMYCLFYHKFCKNGESGTDPRFWRKYITSKASDTWLGLTFERVCTLHVWEIIRAIRMDVIPVKYYSWRKPGEGGAQIDLLIERSDKVAEICEMKYSAGEYVLTSEESEKIRWRQTVFQNDVRTVKGTEVVLVTTLGLKPGVHTDIVQHIVTLDDLFERVPRDYE